jgi:hypothetical protein
MNRRPEHASPTDDQVINVYDELPSTNKPNLFTLPSLFLRALYNFIPVLFIMFTIFTISVHTYDSIYLFIHGNALRAKMHIKQPNEIKSLSNGKATYTVFEVSRDRYAYEKSLPLYQSKIPPSDNAQIILFDIESDPPLKLPHMEQKPTNMHLIRKEPNGQREKFSIWDSFVFAMNHIETERVFYFDNCNYPTSYFQYKFYLDTNTNHYFPNTDRYYTQNFLAHRHDIVRFLSELPLHIIQDPRSFFGGDQLLIWYLYSYRSNDIMYHIHHEALAEYKQWHSHSIIVWRMFLYMNRYGTPVGGIGNMHKGWCNDKRAICVYGGLLRRFVALPVVWHVIEAAMRLEFIFWLVATVVNLSGSWILGFFISIAVAFISLSIIYELLKRSAVRIYKSTKMH